MSDMKFTGPPKYTIFGINPEGVAAFRTGAKSIDAARSEIWMHSKSFPSLSWRVFEANWKEIDIPVE